MNSDISISSEDFEFMFGSISSPARSDQGQDRYSDDLIDGNLCEEIVSSIPTEVLDDDDEDSFLRSGNRGKLSFTKIRALKSPSKQHQRRSRKQNISNVQVPHDEDIAVVSEGQEILVSEQHEIVITEEFPDEEKIPEDVPYPKPVYSYSSLIALALKNSPSGRMHVSEIYKFICGVFPFFRTAPPGWKNSIRHNLSLNKVFTKIVIGSSRDGFGRSFCLWALNKEKLDKVDSEIRRSREKQPAAARKAYANPTDMEQIETGEKGIPYSGFVPRPAATLKSHQQKKLTRDPLKKSGGKRQLSRLPNQSPIKLNKKCKLLTGIIQIGTIATNNEMLPCQQNHLVVNRFIPMTPLKRGIYSTNDTPEPLPNSFSTPIRNPAPQLVSQRTPPSVFGGGYAESHVPWQNYQTPQRRGLCLLNDGTISGQSSITGTPEDMRNPHGSPCYTKRLQVKFATALESACCASSAHNNSLIIESPSWD